MPVHIDKAAWLLSAVKLEGVSGTALDCRTCANYGLLFYKGTTANGGESATFNLQASPDGTNWTTVALYTATATLTGTAQIAGYLPYVRALTVKVWTATAHASSATGMVSVFYAPGMQFG